MCSCGSPAFIHHTWRSRLASRGRRGCSRTDHGGPRRAGFDGSTTRWPTIPPSSARLADCGSGGSVEAYQVNANEDELEGEPADARRSSAGRTRVGVVGAGIGGLTAAIALARIGCEVTFVERDDTPIADDVEDTFGGAAAVHRTCGTRTGSRRCAGSCYGPTVKARTDSQVDDGPRTSRAGQPLR